MSENTPLLPQSSSSSSGAHEHPIFLRVCHSPWTFIGQKSLMAFRGAILTYMTTVWIATLNRDITEEDDSKLFAFYAGHISFTTQLIYYAITSTWTAQHLISPRNRPQRDTSDEGRIESLRNRAYSLVSIPRTTDFTELKRFAFSVFYSSAVTFPFVVSFLHWCILGDRHGKSWTDDDNHDWLMFSAFGLNSLIATGEILFLSSVRKIKPFTGHTVTLASMSGLYFAWARFGHFITGEYPYTYVNPELNTRRGMFFNVTTSMALTVAMFLVVVGLHEGRDIVAKKAECDRRD